MFQFKCVGDTYERHAQTTAQLPLPVAEIFFWLVFEIHNSEVCEACDKNCGFYKRGKISFFEKKEATNGQITSYEELLADSEVNVETGENMKKLIFSYKLLFFENITLWAGLYACVPQHCAFVGLYERRPWQHIC